MHQDANQSWTSWHASRGIWSSSEATELQDGTAPPLGRSALNRSRDQSRGGPDLGGARELSLDVRAKRARVLHAAEARRSLRVKRTALRAHRRRPGRGKAAFVAPLHRSGAFAIACGRGPGCANRALARSHLAGDAALERL
jgi:hypothetical protein